MKTSGARSQKTRAKKRRRTGSPLNSHPSTLNQFPFVFSNFAITADGKIAFADRSFVPFAGKRDQQHMMELRATADAVLSGARTIELSSATLGPGGKKYQQQRLKRGLPEYNLRIIVTGSGSIDPNAEIFKHQFSPIIVLTTGRATLAARQRLQQLGAIVKICGRKEINFRMAFRWLRARWR
jgi:riboflavin biosynthesis pyrimidine reductase